MNTMRIAFSTLAFPDKTLTEAASLGRSRGYAGVELRLIDGQLFDSSMPAAERARVKETTAAFGGLFSAKRIEANNPLVDA